VTKVYTRNKEKQQMFELADLQNMTVEELRQIASEMGVPGFSSLRKQDLCMKILMAQSEHNGHSYRYGILEVTSDGRGYMRVNGYKPDPHNERLRLETPNPHNITGRLLDIVTPIGRGQRGLIVAPPKAGKTTILKEIANSLTTNYNDLRLMVLLIDERPEEVTDISRSVDGEVISSTFDEMPENHMRVAELVLARAKRLVEMGEDVVVLMDSITRLARASNLTVEPSGRTLSGGLDPTALYRPKRFLGSARNIENGGSLTILATILVETGSRMDDMIFEEFKATGNLDLVLSRELADRLRKALHAMDPVDATETLLSGLRKTNSNQEFLAMAASAFKK